MTIGVFGATGHTGRFVVDELQRRGQRFVAIGRDEERLARLGDEHPGGEVRVAAVDDAAALDRALRGVAVVVNCAGPFLDTADEVIRAALRARAHYLDVTAEQASAEATFADHDGAAKAAGVTVVPAMAFYGGLADLLATAALKEERWTTADQIDVAVALDRWWPTAGTRRTGERNTARRFVLVDGAKTFLGESPRERAWTFPPPFGTQDVREVPLSEIVTLGRHLSVRTVRSYMNLAPLRDLNDPSLSLPSGRSEQLFALDVLVQRGGRERRVTARGRDIYAISGRLVVEAALRIADGRVTRRGAVAPGELFESRDFLAALADEMTIDYDR